MLKNWQADVLFLVLLGVIVAMAFWLAPLAQIAAAGVGMPADDTMQDQWDTPYYLRYNTATDRGSGIFPEAAQQTYALGVPSSSGMPRILQVQAIPT